MGLKERFTVKLATRSEAKGLLRKFHYLGLKGFRSQVIYGLYENDECLGVCIFHGVSAPETVVGAFGLKRTSQEGVWELGRLVLAPELNGGNVGSFLVGGSIRKIRRSHDVRAIISYADSSLHTGSIYQACNFLYCGLTSPKKDFWVNGKIQHRGKTKGVEGVWQSRTRKHRYILVFDKSLNLKWPTLTYPKKKSPIEVRAVFL